MREFSSYGVDVVISHVMDKSVPSPLPREDSQRVKGTIHRQRRKPGHCIRSSKIPKGPVWTYISFVYRPQALSDHLESQNSSSFLSSSQNATLGSNFQAHIHQVEYRPSTEYGNADAVSRVPCDNPPLKEETEIYFFSGLAKLPMEAKDISRDTRRDPVLTRVLNYTLTGWPNYVPSKGMKPYFTRRHGITYS